MKKLLANIAAAALLAANVTLAHGAQMMAVDGYEVHFSAFNSTFLEPEVAKQHGLKRSRDEAVINITVLETCPTGEIKTVPASISGQAVNLAGQIKDLDFKKVTEAETIYYVSNVDFTDEEKLRFEIDIRPRGWDKPEPVHIEFTQQFFVD